MSNSDDDNYDDLDDYLDEMGDVLLNDISNNDEKNQTSIESHDNQDGLNDELDEHELQKEIDEQMEKLFGAAYSKDEKSQEALKNLMMKLADEYEGSDDNEETDNESESKDKKDSGTGNNPKDIISGTLNRLKKQDEKVQKNMQEAKEQNELEEMMNQLSSLGLDKNLESLLSSFGDMNGDDDEQGFSDNLLKDMLKDFTGKDILYEPMKQMETDIVTFIENNKAKLPPEELQKFKDQQAINKKIVALFEEPNYDDSDEATRAKLANYLDELHELGQLQSNVGGEGSPNSVFNNMPPLPLDANFKNMKDECVQQ